MKIGEAVEALFEGKKVAREGWNGKDMFICMVSGSRKIVDRPPPLSIYPPGTEGRYLHLLGIYPPGTEVTYLPHVDMKTVDGYIVPWMCSQTDLLANDWVVVP